MRQPRWVPKWQNNDNPEKEEEGNEGRRGIGTRGRVPWRWRRGSSEGRRQGSTKSSAEHEAGPFSHGLF